MSGLFHIALQGLRADSARVEQHAANIVNVLTPGHRRGMVLTAPLTGADFAAHMRPVPARGEPGEGLGLPAGVVQAIDMRAGPLRQTGAAWDLALEGKGWFEVQTPSGPAYTRQGSFRLDAEGRLVTAGGHPVMGQAGEVRLAPGAQPRVTADGAIHLAGSDQDAPVARLKVVEVEDEATLRPLGAGLLQAPEVSRRAPPAGPGVQVRQGWLEGSNVSHAVEMSGLVRAMRHFESMQKLAQIGDEMLGTAIRRLGEKP